MEVYGRCDRPGVGIVVERISLVVGVANRVLKMNNGWVVWIIWMREACCAGWNGPQMDGMNEIFFTLFRGGFFRSRTTPTTETR